MKKLYADEDYLMLSGIQHMAFCERQWALIHIEQAWAENVRTLEGKYLHERVDDFYEDETRKDIRVVRAMPILSHELGFRGVADVVEFNRMAEVDEETAVSLKNQKGFWKPHPVEYKRGRPKRDDRDAVQLCAQAMALEEMFMIKISSGFLFYGQTRRREHIGFSNALRDRVRGLSEKMHKMMAKAETPKAINGKHCSLCSLKEICQPSLTIVRRPIQEYLARMVDLEVMDY